MDLILPNWIDAPSTVGAFATSRRGGCSRLPYDDGSGGGGLNLGVHVGDSPEHVQQNRLLLRSFLPADPAWLTQIHSATVVNASDVASAPDADASITNKRGVVCVIQTADCLPVLFCDTAGTVVGAAHAGWRGLASGVLENTVSGMRDLGASEILAWLGPAIGPEQFEVGKEVVTAFAARDSGTHVAFKPIACGPDKYLADIYCLARILLSTIGVHKVFGGESCTVSEQLRFYSYRRDRVTGRMASLIWLK